MTDIGSFFAHDERAQIYRPGDCAEQGRYVLYWMQRSQRGHDNPALNAAIALGNQLKLPVVVLFVLTTYPAANLRHYTFMLEGLAVTARDLRRRGTPLILRHGEPAREVARLAHELSVAAVICDQCELRTPQGWRQEVKERLDVPFACVDGDVVVPAKFFPKAEYAARTLRPKIERLLPTYLQPVVDVSPEHKLSSPPCDLGLADKPLQYLERLKIDRSIEPSSLMHGGQDEGSKAVQRLLHERLYYYSERRNDPLQAGTSEISPYLHFGQLSVQQLAWDVEQYQPPETGSAKIDITAGRAAYLEELIVRRELAINFAWRNSHYDTLEGCPDWSLKTLRKHQHDPRQWVYTRDELEQARTHDELWNASQLEMMQSGRMHGYMRMYWGKKILEWTESPEEAFEYAVYLNDKYELDGRDANGYVGISWAIGGLHDRPWKERPIFGMVRYMSTEGMKRKFDIAGYISKYGVHPA